MHLALPSLPLPRRGSGTRAQSGPALLGQGARTSVQVQQCRCCLHAYGCHLHGSVSDCTQYAFSACDSFASAKHTECRRYRSDISKHVKCPEAHHGSEFCRTGTICKKYTIMYWQTSLLGPWLKQRLAAVSIPTLSLQLLDFLSCSFMGGTDVDRPLELSLQRLQQVCVFGGLFGGPWGLTAV